MPKDSGGRRRLIILIAFFLIIAMTIGYLAYLFTGITELLGGGGGGAGLEGCKWRAGVNMSSSYVPGYEAVFVAMNISKLAEGDYNLTLVFANEGGSLVDLTDELAGGTNQTPKMTVLFFDEYGDVVRKSLAISSTSMRILPQNQLKYQFTLSNIGGDKVYVILYFHNLPLRLGAWLEDPTGLAGSCGEYITGPTNKTLVYARWATLVQGLTVLESILYSNASAPVQVSYTGDTGNGSATLFSAEIYDPYNYMVQKMASPPLGNTTRFQVPPNGYLVTGVSAGQIWGEPAKMKLTYNMTVDGKRVEGYEGDYSEAGWTDEKPGAWVVRGYSNTLSNGLELTMTYAYNGYLLVIRDVSITNPSDHVILMAAKASASPVQGIPLPALKVEVMAQNDTRLDGGWIMLSTEGLHINKTEGEAENLVFYYELQPGASVPGTGVVTYKALYGQAYKLLVTTPWGEIVTLYFTDMYQAND